MVDEDWTNKFENEGEEMAKQEPSKENQQKIAWRGDFTSIFDKHRGNWKVR